MPAETVIPVKIRIAERAVQRFNQDHPIGTPVTYWPGVREGDGRASRTRTPAWLVSGTPCVSVEGYPGGIALTHIEVREMASA
jgi:hypothetical protein